MRDTLLHIPLFAAFGVIVNLLCGLPLDPSSIALSGSFVGFIRELTQAQTRADNNFLTCWDFRNWSSAKQFETFAPMAVLVFGALIIEVSV
jgi:hypothetical protein